MQGTPAHALRHISANDQLQKSLHKLVGGTDMVPWSRLFIDIFQIIANDVGLLQEQAHAIGQVIWQIPMLQLACLEELQCTVWFEHAHSRS